MLSRQRVVIGSHRHSSRGWLQLAHHGRSGFGSSQGHCRKPSEIRSSTGISATGEGRRRLAVKSFHDQGLTAHLWGFSIDMCAVSGLWVQHISFGLGIGLKVMGIISLLVKGHTNTVSKKLHGEHGRLWVMIITTLHSVLPRLLLLQRHVYMVLMRETRCPRWQPGFSVQ
jgi:hypothetical protein